MAREILPLAQIIPNLDKESYTQLSILHAQFASE